MENVLKFESYTNEFKGECEWDLISSIFDKAIKRKGLTKDEVQHISDKIIKEVRGNKEDKKKLKLLTIEDIMKLTGYNTSNLRKFKKDLFSLKYDNMSIFGRFNDTASNKNDMILINPLFYHRGSDLNELNFLANLFGIRAKRNINL